MTKFLATHPLLGTSKKPSSQSNLERSIYYWWWAYLKRNIEYMNYCEKPKYNSTSYLSNLYRDFGDIRSNDFRNWFGGKNQKGPYLFGEREISKINLFELKDSSDWGKDWNKDIHVIALNTKIGKTRLKRYFNSYLQRLFKDKKNLTRARIRIDRGTSRYTLHQNFNVKSLKKNLEVYDEIIKNNLLSKGEKLKLWEIGQKLKIANSSIIRTNDSQSIIEDKKLALASAVSRAYKNAKNMIANTTRGQFPNAKLLK
jgi:hypothetical protein